MAEESLSERRGLGLLLHVGPYSGFGAGVQVGSQDIGVRVSMGWTPVLLVIADSSSLKFHSTLGVAPDFYVRLASPRPTTHIGAQLGYRYNSLLGHGLAIGGYAQFGLNRTLDGLISAGLIVFPDGDNRVRQEDNFSSSTTFSFPGPTVSFGVSLGLAIFP